MKYLNYGILSTASIVPRFINAVKETKHSTVAAIASRSLQKAEEWASSYDIPAAYGSYEELLGSPDIDIVYIAMINSEHFKYAELALKAGKHVLCEKPFTLTKTEAASLFALANKQKLFIMEAQKVVFLPVMKKIKEIIANGTLGNIYMVDCASSYDVTGYGWYYNAEYGGGVLLGNGIYCLEMAQFIFDCQVSEYAGLCTRSHTSVEDQFAITFQMENGTLFVNKSSTRVETQNVAYIYGEKGHIVIPEYWKARTAVIHFNTGEQQVIEYPCEHELVYEIDHVFECIQSGLTLSPVMTEQITVDSIGVLADLKNKWEK